MGRGTKRLVALEGSAAFALATGVAGAAGTLFQPYQAVGSTTTVRVSGTASNKGIVSASAFIDGAADDPNAANDRDSASIIVR